MAYSTTDTAVLEIARVNPPVPTGDIIDIAWYNGTTWLSLLAAPITVDIDYLLTLSVVWQNTGKRRSRGRVTLTITAPDNSQFNLSPNSGQNTVLAQNESAAVDFASFPLDQAGSYRGSVILEMEIA